MADERSDQLVDSVVRAGLVGPEVTPTLEFLRTQFHDPDGLAREMVRRNWLTTYQADRLLGGRTDELELGPYLLLELLGEGGMGRVYKARHRLMNRVVALKVIRAELLSLGEARVRFLREIEAAARVWHPNLVTALDAAPLGDGFVLVMEYVEGTNLARLLKQQGVPPIRHACDWARQAALGLHHAHGQGLIHRDVKPSNLLLTADGDVVKVMDLGLARLDLAGERTSGDEPLTASGVVIGTPDYMAPEQAIAPREADARADVYSLGCTLYHLLSGRPPFPGGSLTQKLLWHQTAEPPELVRLRPAIPASLAHVVSKMMAKRPEQRYATAAEAAADLDVFRSAASRTTLHVPELPAAPDPAVTPAPSRPAPVVRHEPRPAEAYDLVDPPPADEEPAEPPVEATVGVAAPTLAHPAVAEDDSWWKDDPQPAHAGPALTPQPTPAPAAAGPAPTARNRGPLVAAAVGLAALAALACWAALR